MKRSNPNQLDLFTYIKTYAENANHTLRGVGLSIGEADDELLKDVGRLGVKQKVSHKVAYSNTKVADRLDFVHQGVPVEYANGVVKKENRTLRDAIVVAPDYVDSLVSTLRNRGIGQTTAASEIESAKAAYEATQLT